MKRLQHAISRSLEFLLVLFLFAAASPFLLLVAFLIKLDSRGPIFYFQKRYGQDKRIFEIYKFRTMRVGAENGRPIWGKESDPRASRLGKILRVLHVDELPQLVNVLKGEMSLVGPRPERPYFADRFEELMVYYRERYRVKPGITGWAQVNGLRGESSIEERTRLDRFYVENHSFLFDLKILLMTPFAKPIKHPQLPVMIEYKYPYSHVEEVLPRPIPLMVPIRNA
jgi:lipopolysaccharide/colanic/teichoic acid biosynthesis glycosyltransferase